MKLKSYNDWDHEIENTNLVNKAWSLMSYDIRKQFSNIVVLKWTHNSLRDICNICIKVCRILASYNGSFVTRSLFTTRPSITAPSIQYVKIMLPLFRAVVNFCSINRPSIFKCYTGLGFLCSLDFS